MRLFSIILAAATLTAASVVATLQAKAQDYVYADSFGNLVVESGSGYKRIVVGQGAHVKEVRKYLDSERPRVIYGDPVEPDRYDAYRPGYEAPLAYEQYENRSRVFNNRGVFRNWGVFNN